MKKLLSIILIITIIGLIFFSINEIINSNISDQEVEVISGELVIESPHLVEAIETPEITETLEFELDPKISTSRYIWDLLTEKYGFTEVAAAAILGNLRHESGLCTYRHEHFSKIMSSKLHEYSKDDRNKFIYEDKGYGLAGWTGTTNKVALWDFCEENGYDIDSIDGQIAFLVKSYKESCPGSYERINYYTPEEIVYASEEFRQSYEKAISYETSQYYRAKYAISYFLDYSTSSEEVLDSVRNLKELHYDIYLRVNELNEELGIERKR